MSAAKVSRLQLPLFPDKAGEMSRLEMKFWDFHIANPKVYRWLVKLARQWREKRGSAAHLGIKTLFERVRWELDISITSEDGLKLNNNHTAFYARLIMMRNPDLRNIFRLRQQRIASTIGPVNETLEPNEHIS